MSRLETMLIEDAPPLPGRTVIRDPHAMLCLAVLQDAFELLEKSEHPSPVVREEAVEARRWLLDWRGTEPFSLSWICETLEVFGGVPWNAREIARLVRAGAVAPLGDIRRPPSRGRIRMQRHRGSRSRFR